MFLFCFLFPASFAIGCINYDFFCCRSHPTGRLSDFCTICVTSPRARAIFARQQGLLETLFSLRSLCFGFSLQYLLRAPSLDLNGLPLFYDLFYASSVSTQAHVSDFRIQRSWLLQLLARGLQHHAVKRFIFTFVRSYCVFFCIGRIIQRINGFMSSPSSCRFLTRLWPIVSRDL